MMQKNTADVGQNIAKQHVTAVRNSAVEWHSGYTDISTTVLSIMQFRFYRVRIMC